MDKRRDKKLIEALEIIKTLTAELWGAYDATGGQVPDGVEPDVANSNAYHFKNVMGEGVDPAAAVDEAQAFYKSLGLDLWEEM